MQLRLIQFPPQKKNFSVSLTLSGTIAAFARTFQLFSFDNQLPVPTAPSMDQPFKLHVDANDVGTGAVLFQMVVEWIVL